ncbi:MAG: SLC13 family permease [Ignisphaera sp.]
MYAILVLLSLALLIAFLIWGKVERHWVGLGLALLLIVSGAISPLEAVGYIDWDVLGLILGVSIYTVYLERSGFAYVVARSILKRTGHSLYVTLFTLSFSAGLVSIFVENVSVVLLFYPITFALSNALGIEPTIPMIFVALSSNMAGSATMVGDPPAILTAGAFKLSFMDFIIYDGKPSMFFFTLISMILAITVAGYISLKNVKIIGVGNVGGTSNALEEVAVDRTFLMEAIAFLIAKISILSLRNVLAVPLSFSAAIAVGGLTLTRLLHRDTDSVKQAFKQGFEWKLIVFLTSIFILSGAFEKHGIAKAFGEYIVYRLGGDVFKITSVLIWLCATFSAVIDNVPMTLTMIPVIKTASNLLTYNPVVLMWSVLIGITLGGNLTYIGASANVAAVRILEKNDHSVTFVKFMRISLIYNTISLLAAWLLYTLIYV